MKIDKVRNRINELQEYVDAYDNYVPVGVKQMAIKLYAESNNVSAVAKELNELGFRKDGKLVAGKRAQVKLNSNDVTDLLVIKADPEDELHEMVRKVLNQNRRRKGIVV